MPLLFQGIDDDLRLVVGDGEGKSRCAGSQAADGIIHDQAGTGDADRRTTAGDSPFFDAAHYVLPIDAEVEFIIEHDFINLRFQIDLQVERPLQLLYVGSDPLDAGLGVGDHNAADHSVDREFAAGREERLELLFQFIPEFDAIGFADRNACAITTWCADSARSSTRRSAGGRSTATAPSSTRA